MTATDVRTAHDAALAFSAALPSPVPLEVVPAALRVMSMTAVLSSSARVWRARKIGVKGAGSPAPDAGAGAGAPGAAAAGAASVPECSATRSPSHAKSASATGVPASERDVIETSSTSGCGARRRSSSTPV